MLGEYENPFDYTDQVREQSGGNYVWIESLDPMSGQMTQEAVTAPATASINQLAELGINIAKIYQMTNGQQVKYVPVQTAAGVQYQRQSAGVTSMFSDPMVLLAIGLGLFVALK